MNAVDMRGIFALEPETGKVLWKFDVNEVTRRGLAYWPGDRSLHPRVYAGTGSNLIAIDVTTGKPAPGFGNEGLVDMKKGVLGDLPDENRPHSATIATNRGASDSAV